MGVSKEFAILFAVIFLPGLVSQGTGVDPAGWDRVGYHITLLSVAIPQVLLVVYMTQLRTPGVAARMGWRRPRWSDALSGLVAIISVLSALALFGLIASFAEIPSILEPRVQWEFTRMALLPLVVLSSVAVGYREEIFYRAYCLVRGEEAGAGPVAVIAASTVLFAAGHLYQGVAGFLMALVIGAVFAGVFYYRRSLHGIAVAHGIYNTLVLVLSSHFPAT